MFNIKTKHINSDNLETLACTDLGAYKPIGKNNLKNTGIQKVVIMEDRLPDFFLEYKKFEPNKDTTLNRHGPLKFLNTQNHLKKLVNELHEQGIKVYLGFWGQLMDPHSNTCCPFIDNHPELWTLYHDNENNLDIDPLVTLQPENISFAQYVINQFTKLINDFNFDGLFLGDGLNGYRLFSDPTKYKDQEHSKNKWTQFYAELANGIHELDCQLLAYDYLGFAPEQAIMHGADYLAQAESGLDYLIVQTYPTAWGKKWLKNFPGFDFDSCLNNLKATKNKLKNTNCKVIYTLEIGDTVEGWKSSYWTTKKQLKHFNNHADGKLLVWANDLFSKL